MPGSSSVTRILPRDSTAVGGAFATDRLSATINWLLIDRFLAPDTAEWSSYRPGTNAGHQESPSDRRSILRVRNDEKRRIVRRPFASGSPPRVRARRPVTH